ncbi:MAG: hypothetical protein E6706_00990 [Anaerococcus hydrogenalis]|nr:hypothetical protein [Anaerococcus hydrogenalis]
MPKYKAIDAIRKEVKHDCLDLDDVSAFIYDKNLENYDESEKILEILPKKDREIFKKLFIEGYSYDDLEKITKIPKDRLYIQQS